IKTELLRLKLWLTSLIFAGGVGGGIGLREIIRFFS
ncbi:unnamed protein product, partial [marine sediment metagenome]